MEAAKSAVVDLETSSTGVAGSPTWRLGSGHLQGGVSWCSHGSPEASSEAARVHAR